MTDTVAPLLTTRQRRIVEFIRAHTIDYGYCPSVRDVQRAVGLQSSSAVTYQLRELERMGWISRVPGKARTLRILNPTDGTDS